MIVINVKQQAVGFFTNRKLPMSQDVKKNTKQSNMQRATVLAEISRSRINKALH